MTTRQRLFAVLQGAILLLASALANAATPIFINEFHYDNLGTDVGEFIEIAGPAGTDLAGYEILLYSGAGGAVYNTNALSGVITDQQNGFGMLWFGYPAGGIQNGSPDGIALVNGSTVVQFLSYEGSFTASDGTASGTTSVDIGVSQSGMAAGDSLQLQGTGTTYEDFTWSLQVPQTRGFVNIGQEFSAAAIPEPETYGMLLAGLALMGFAARRRRKL